MAHYFITTWDIVLLVGTFTSVLLVAFGLIYWFSGINTKKGRKMVIGGIILLIAMRWLAVNPPWIIIIG